MNQKIEIKMSKGSDKMTKAWLVPTSEKKCSCGMTIWFGFHFAGEKSISIVIAKDITEQSLLEPSKEIYVNHYLNCIDWEKYK